MLCDPKWDKPSVAGFRAWLEQQDPEERFNYGSCRYCAVGQYLDSVGTSWDQTAGFMVEELNKFAYRAVLRDNTCLPTFGAVLREIDEAA
jgi:hypothetical protein